jgi:hypothetical protein
MSKPKAADANLVQLVSQSELVKPKKHLFHCGHASNFVIETRNIGMATHR